MISDVMSVHRGGRGGVTAPSVTSSSVFEDSQCHSDVQILSLSQDPKFVSRLYKKVAAAYVDRGANGIAVLNEKFLRLDKTLNEENFTADQWSFKAFLGSGQSTLTDKELSILFVLLDQEASGEVDLAEVMLHLRKQFYCTTQQFHDIIKKVRSLRLQSADATWTISGQELHQQRQSRKKEGANYRGVRADAFDYLVYHGRLTQSEAFLVLEKCTATINSNGLEGGGGGLANERGDEDPALSMSPIIQELDTEYLETVLFEFPMPHDVAYPILMGKLVDSLSDPATSHSGSMGVLRAAQQVKLAVDVQSLQDMQEAEAAKDPYYYDRPENIIDEHQNNSGSLSSAPGGRPRYWGESDTASPSGRILKDQDIESSLRRLHKYAGHVYINRGSFRQLITALGGGLPAGECDVLFSYIADPASELLTLRQLLKDVVKRLPVPSPHKLQLVVSTVRSQIVGNQGGAGINVGGGGGTQITNSGVPLMSPSKVVSGSGASSSSRGGGQSVSGGGAHHNNDLGGTSYFGLNALHLALSVWGEEECPVDAVINAMRRCGVGRSITSDVEIESMCLQAPTCIELVLLLRGILPKGRASLLQQLFKKLDVNQTGLVDRQLVLEEFMPNALDRKVGINTRALEKEVRMFINSLPQGDEQMSFEEFTYFWGNISASIPEDSTFTLLLWKGYDMCHDGNPVTPSRRRGGARRMSPSATSSRSDRAAGEDHGGSSVGGVGAPLPCHSKSNYSGSEFHHHQGDTGGSQGTPRRKFRKFLGE